MWKNWQRAIRQTLSGGTKIKPSKPIKHSNCVLFSLQRTYFFVDNLTIPGDAPLLLNAKVWDEPQFTKNRQPHREEQSPEPTVYQTGTKTKVNWQDQAERSRVRRELLQPLESFSNPLTIHSSRLYCNGWWREPKNLCLFKTSVEDVSL